MQSTLKKTKITTVVTTKKLQPDGIETEKEHMWRTSDLWFFDDIKSIKSMRQQLISSDYLSMLCYAMRKLCWTKKERAKGTEWETDTSSTERQSNEPIDKKCGIQILPYALIWWFIYNLWLPTIFDDCIVVWKLSVRLYVPLKIDSKYFQCYECIDILFEGTFFLQSLSWIPSKLNDFSQTAAANNLTVLFLSFFLVSMKKKSFHTKRVTYFTLPMKKSKSFSLLITRQGNPNSIFLRTLTFQSRKCSLAFLFIGRTYIVVSKYHTWQLVNSRNN